MSMVNKHHYTIDPRHSHLMVVVIEVDIPTDLTLCLENVVLLQFGLDENHQTFFYLLQNKRLIVVKNVIFYLWYKKPFTEIFNKIFLKKNLDKFPNFPGSLTRVCFLHFRFVIKNCFQDPGFFPILDINTFLITSLF